MIADLRNMLIKEDGIKVYMNCLAAVLDKEETNVSFGARIRENKTRNIRYFVDNNRAK